MFSIITVNYNNPILLSVVLDRTMNLLRGHEFEVIVVDNGSTDGSLGILTKLFAGQPLIRVIGTGRNGGFGYGCNFGASFARTPVLWFLNSDAWVSSIDGLEQALALVAQSGTGVVGTSVFLDSKESTPQGGSNMTFGYFVFSSLRPGWLFRKLPKPVRQFFLPALRKLPGVFGQYAKSFGHHRACSPYISRGVGGASFLIKASVFNDLKGFDEMFFLYDEDGDICLRCIELGLTNYVVPNVSILNYLSATTSKMDPKALKIIKRDSRLRLISKHFSGAQKSILQALTLLTWRFL